MVLRALLLKPLLRRPWRFLITVLGVAAGVAAVVSTVASSRAAVAAFAQGVEEVAGRARLEVVGVGGVPDSTLTALRPLTDAAVVAPVVERTALLVELGDGVQVLGVDLLLDQSVRPVEEDVAGPRAMFEKALTGRAVILPAPLAEELGVAVGDRVTLSARARPVSLEVAGVITPPGPASAWQRVVVMDVALAQELFGSPGRLDRVELVPRDGVRVAELRRRLEGVLPPGDRVEEPSRRRQAAEQMVSSLRFNLVALSGISVLVGAVLVATTLATSVVQRRYTIAVLRSHGASTAQIAAGISLEAALIGLGGGVLGIAGGFAGARLALASVRSTVAAVLRGIPLTEIRFSWELAAAALVLALGTALAAAVLPVMEATRTPPVQGLHHGPPTRLGRRTLRRALAAAALLGLAAAVLARMPAVGGLPVAALAAALALMVLVLVLVGPLIELVSWFGGRALARLRGVAVRLAAAALAAGRRRAAWAAGAVAVAVALAVAIVTLVTSFRATVVAWSQDGMRADIWIRPLAVATGLAVGGLDPELVTIAQGLFGADAVDPFYPVEIPYGGRTITVAGAAFDVVRHYGNVGFPGRDSRAIFAEAYRVGGAIVNEPFANRFGVTTGDRLHLDVPGGPLEPEVVGVFRDYSHAGGLVVMDRHLLLPHFPDAVPHEIALFLGPGADVAAARRRLLDAVRGRFLIQAFTARRLQQEILAAFERTFAITTALYLVAAAVAVVAVATVLLALVGERRRDLGLLRAVGGSRPQVFAVVVAQAGLLGLTAAVAGAAVGLLVGVVLVKVVNLQSFGWTLELVLPWQALGRIGAWVLAGCLLAGVAPAVGAARLQPAEVLREDG